MFGKELNEHVQGSNSVHEKEKILRYLDEIRYSDTEDEIGDKREAMVIVLLQMNKNGQMLLEAKERDILECERQIPENVRRRAIRILMADI